MSAQFSVAVFNGDGIGPEIMAPTIRLLEKLQRQSNDYSLEFSDVCAGAQLYADTGSAFPDESKLAAKQADAILLSAMGLPSVRYADGTEISPQLDLRIELDLFAGVRPVRIQSDEQTPLKFKQAVDFVLIRESTEGLFHSRGIGNVTADEATETLKITRKTSEKLFKFAFELAGTRMKNQQGPGRVTCVDKANVFRSFAFFRELFDKEAQGHSGIHSDHAYVDATALWMVEKPWVFDVLVTENMFGDILSDLGAGLMGGLGLAPSADIGEQHAVFQPCHGSAPDIAGQNKANPFAMILSAAMMLEWLGQRNNIASMVIDGKRLSDAVYACLSDNNKITADIGGVATTLGASSAVDAALFDDHYE